MTEPAPQAAPFCLRCPGVSLCLLGGSQSIEFFECPSCHRQYARKESGSLTYRWLHPISLVLYGVLFSENPAAAVPWIADRLADSFSSAKLEAMIDEIERELTQPTQQVRDILDNPQPEEVCRQFLADVANLLRERLAKAPPSTAAV